MDGSMRICFLTHAFPPAQTAASLYSGNFVTGLLDKGFDVTVITTSRKDQPIPVEKIDNLSIRRINLQLPTSLDYFEFMSKLYPVLGKEIKNNEFDIIHSEHLFPAPIAGSLAKKFNIPHIVTIEGVSNVSPYSKLLFQMHKLLLPRVHYDALVSWGKFILENYFLEWGIRQDKSLVIPGAVDTKMFSPEVNGRQIRKRLVYDEKLIMTAKPMYLTNALGLAHIIKAMKLVTNEYKDCKLIIGGTGRMHNKLVNLKNKLGLKNEVKFVGWIPQHEMPKYYRAANLIVDSFIFSHPGSITVLESLATGVPNVLTKIECLPGEQNIPNSDIAVLTEPANHESIAKGIITLLEDEKLGEKLGRNARKFIVDNFSLEKVIKDYLVLYERLLTSIKG